MSTQAWSMAPIDPDGGAPSPHSRCNHRPPNYKGSMGRLHQIRRSCRALAIVVLLACMSGITMAAEPATQPAARKTVVSIEGPAFHVNGKPTYAGRSFRGMKVEGL